MFILRALIAFGASVTCTAPPEGDTPLHLAMRMRIPAEMLPLVRELVECGADLNALNDTCQTPANIAKSKNIPGLSRLIRSALWEKKLPSVLGFWGPWFQILGCAVATNTFG